MQVTSRNQQIPLHSTSLFHWKYHSPDPGTLRDTFCLPDLHVIFRADEFPVSPELVSNDINPLSVYFGNRVNTSAGLGTTVRLPMDRSDTAGISSFATPWNTAIRVPGTASLEDITACPSR